FIVSELRHFRDERSRTSGFFPYLHCLVFKEHSAVLSLLPFATTRMDALVSRVCHGRHAYPRQLLYITTTISVMSTYFFARRGLETFNAVHFHFQ
ncbi:MAG: hypothetical protein ABFC84_17060, partial [Veillonellales bacterium]